MRPVLVELGPWAPWVIPVLALLIASALALWSRLETRQDPSRQPSRLDLIVGAVFSVGLALALYFLVNTHGPVPIRSYGFMMLVGLVAGLGWLAYAGRAPWRTPAALVDLALLTLLGGIIGARLMYVALDWDLYRAHPLTMLRLWEGGLSFHGGLAGGVLGAYVFARMHHVRLVHVIDMCAPGIALAYAFARIGCFLNGCCFGGPTSGAWGVCFAPTSEAGAFSQGPLFPAQLLAAAFSALSFLILVWVRPVFRRPGHLFLVYLGLYGIERFVADIWRYGASGRPFPLLPAITEAQALSIFLTVVATIIIAATWPRGSAEAEPAVREKKP
ncbi:MAG TPA: prolipoprotein diacylglyceryl transferase [Armatimonadota bacterium]|jgi:phosphatidylglycerol:prolipoprotein diacylglycerol transferase